MKADIMAGILAALPSDVAQKVTVELANRFKAPTDAAALSAPAAAAQPAVPTQAAPSPAGAPPAGAAAPAASAARAPTPAPKG
jgi:hypothetical protein